jgi:hypothetical protein
MTYGLAGFNGSGRLIAASAIVFAALLFDRRRMVLGWWSNRAGRTRFTLYLPCVD